MKEVDHPGEGHPLAGEHRRLPSEDERFDAVDPGPPTERVRIAGVEAAVAAGLVRGGDDDDFGLDEDGLDEDFPSLDSSVADRLGAPPVPEMPDWSEPATGQVPRVLLEGFDDTQSDPDGTPAVRGPVWRERDSDWDDDDDLSDLAVEGETLIPIGSGSIDDEDPYGFDFGPRRSRTSLDDPPSRETAVVPTDELSRMARLGRNARPAPPSLPEGVVYGPVPPPAEERDDGEMSSEQAWENWTGPESGPVPAAGGAEANGNVLVARKAEPRHSARRGRYGPPQRRARRPAPLRLPLPPSPTAARS